MKWQPLTFLRLLLLLTVALAGCGTTQQPANAETGGLVIELTTKPDPPVAGQVELIVTLMDSSQQAVEGAAVNLLASHSSMANMLTQKQATSIGNGQYSTIFDFSQGSQGDWRVTVEVRNAQPKTLRKNFVITIP